MSKSADSSPQRLFFGFEPSAGVRDSIRSAVPQSHHPQARWVHEEDLHLTLLFLGQVPSESVAGLQQIATGVLAAPFEIELTRLECWGKGKLMCLSMDQVPESLSQIYSNLSEVLRADGFSLDEKKFRPHVTLARKVVGCQRFRLEEPIRWQVSALSLFHSRTFGEPPRYSTLWQRQLAEIPDQNRG